MSEPLAVQVRLKEIEVAFDGQALPYLAQVASGARAGTTGAYVNEIRVIGDLLACVLNQLEQDLDDPVAARSAMEGLNKGRRFFVELDLGWDGSYYTNLADADEASMADAGASAHQDPLFDLLRPMTEGEHVCIPVGQCGAEGKHALLISVTGLKDGEARVSVFNSEGWQCHGGAESLDNAPALSRLMPMSRVYSFLKSLDGSVLKPPSDDSLIRKDWEFANAGAPLLSWLQDGGTAASEVKVSSFRQPRQKAVDCALESRFAWLATVLPEADYKLVKAHALNVLAENALLEEDRAEVLGALSNRITASLSGYAMSAGPCATPALPPPPPTPQV